jgi:hypothetical protein
MLNDPDTEAAAERYINGMKHEQSKSILNGYVLGTHPIMDLLAFLMATMNAQVQMAEDNCKLSLYVRYLWRFFLGISVAWTVVAILNMIYLGQLKGWW